MNRRHYSQIPLTPTLSPSDGERGWRRQYFWLVIFAFLAAGQLMVARAGSAILGIEGSHFILNGKPTFLLGISYYGGLGGSQENIRRDLDDIQQHGFNWIRVWATWTSFGENVSAVDAQGQPRPVFFEKLKWLVAECDGRGLVVDVTLTRGKGTNAIGRIGDFKAHEQAVRWLVKELKPHRNWDLDLGNERDVGDERFVPVSELKSLRAMVRELDPQRLVTASFGGHDLTEQDSRDALLTAKLDFLCPHRPRDPGTASQTEGHTRKSLALMKELGRVAPVHYQEPFRRGYTKWEPKAEDFLTDLSGALKGGAAGWCFHNGSQRGTAESHPRRSFDLRGERLFNQLDAEEQKVVAGAKRVTGSLTAR